MTEEQGVAAGRGSANSEDGGTIGRSGANAKSEGTSHSDDATVGLSAAAERGIVNAGQGSAKKSCVTYILRCSDGSFYTGWTNDLAHRIAAHNAGEGAKYTRSRRPVTLIYFEEFESKEDAMRREVQIKRLTRKEKERLIAAGKEGAAN